MAIEADLDEHLDSLTVTIALDNDAEEPEKQEHECYSADYDIGLPTSAAEVCPHLDEAVLIRDLPPAATEILNLLLNPPSLGTLKNWQYLAALLGMSSPEIADFRTREKPFGRVLRKFAETPLNRLLAVLCDVKRVDVLICLRPHVATLRPRRRPTTVPRALVESHSSTQNTERVNVLAPPAEPFILVTHYEQEKELRKQFKLLFRSLQARCPAGLEIVDINSCLNDSDLSGSIASSFNRANQILMFASNDYIDAVAQRTPTNDDRVRSLQHLHGLMDTEYMRNQSKNYRFRVAVLKGTNRENIPVGWYTNTIIYDFPEQFSDLCERLFDASS